ncbi:MAG: hypothetical protein HY247_03125 [archaeon]|nr:MAG: hypothetical protein HY247_03125 [archaeon]
MVELRVRLEKIEASKLVPESTPDQEVVYKVNVSLKEVERNPGDVRLAFSLDVTAQPAVARITMVGSVEIVGTKQETQQLLTSENPKLAPPILTKVYERTYGTLYLICDALEVPHPLPTLLRE